jgi:hypothetical protein
LRLEGYLLAHKGHARRGVKSTAGLGIECLSLIASEPLGQRSPSFGNVVGGAFAAWPKYKPIFLLHATREYARVGPRIVKVEVLVNVENKVRDAAVGVYNFLES